MEIFRRLYASGRLRAYGPPLTAMSADLWDRAARTALCKTIGELGGGLAAAGAWGLASAAATGGTGGAAGLAALGGAAAANLAYGYGCTNDPDGLPPGDNPEIGCSQSTGCGYFYASSGSPDNLFFGPPFYVFRKITGVFEQNTSGDPDRDPTYFVNLVDCNGESTTLDTGLAGAGVRFWIEPFDGDSCDVDGDPPFQNPGPFPTERVRDTVTNCEVDVTVLGFVDEGNGRAGAAVRVQAVGEEERAAGGVIGGCNFGDTVVYLGPGGGGSSGGGTPGEPGAPGEPGEPGGGGDGGSGGDGGGGGSGGSGGSGGGGPVNFPDPGPGTDDDGLPKWFNALADILTGAAGAALGRVLNDFFATEYPKQTYRLVSVCEKDESGEPVSKSVERQIPAAKQFDAVISRLDALVPLLQGQKDFKQPICREKVEPKGDYRTISFISDERSAGGDGRLRKRFRYRSESGVGLDGVVNHWKDFVWDAGPVCVQHRGHHWGSPQVWASSVDEGKRVIQHAGGEAGIDPNQVGEWAISGSDNPRFGMSGTMRVCTKGGYYWITERLGSNNRPRVKAT